VPPRAAGVAERDQEAHDRKPEATDQKRRQRHGAQHSRSAPRSQGYTDAMNPQRNTIALAMLLMLASLVAACGNKGPLVKPNATSQPTPATTPATPAKPAATDGS
jgi:predicted small lipoprotein YifL